MTYEFQYLMETLGFVAKGLPILPPKQDIDWERFFQLSKEQVLEPLVFHGLKESGLPYPKELIAKQMQSTELTIVGCCAKRLWILDLLNKLEQAGIRVVVVKGFIAAANYAKPECRISSDTDIWIDPADEERACEFFASYGFDVTPRWNNGHHAIAKHKRNREVVEIHVQLYDEIVEEVWFGKEDASELVQEPFQKIVIPEGSCYTLGNTDNLIFMALHMVKHFILSGMSLRMMMDVALFFQKYKDSIDTERFWSTLRGFKYDRLLTVILWAMIHHCGFVPEDFPGIGPDDPEQVDMVLNDLEAGGWLGKNNRQARTASFDEYNRRLLMKDKNKIQYFFFILNWQHSFKLSTLFPGKKRLARHYPYVLKYPVLIPFAWIHRIIFRGLRLLKPKALTKKMVLDSDKINSESKKRIDMFQSLDML